MTSRRKPSSVAKGVNRLMPNPTGEGIRQLLGGEPAGKISMEEAEAGIHAALVKGARNPERSLRGTSEVISRPSRSVLYEPASRSHDGELDGDGWLYIHRMCDAEERWGCCERRLHPYARKGMIAPWLMNRKT